MKITLSDLVEEKNIWEKNCLDPKVGFCIRGEDFDSNEIIFSRYGIAPDDMGPTFGKRFNKGDLLFLTRNPQLRKVAVADREGYCGEKVVVFSSKNSDLFEPGLLPFIFQSETFCQHTLRNTIGSTNKHIRWKDVVSFEFNAVAGSKQQNALEILNKFQECYNNLNESILAVKKLYQDLIDSEIGKNLETASVGRKRGWKSLSTVFQINPKVSTTEDIHPYVDMACLDIELPKIDYKSETKFGKNSGAKFEKNDVLLARITPCFENGKAGYVDFLAEHDVAIGSTEFIVIRSRTLSNKKLGFYVVKTKKFRHYALHHMEGTSGRQRVSARVFDEIFINTEVLSNLSPLMLKFEHIEETMITLRNKKEHYFKLRQALIYALLGV